MNHKQTLALYDEHGARIWNECLRLAKGKRAEADDLFQDFWLRVPHLLERNRKVEPNAEWLVGVLRNVARERLRADARRSRQTARYAAQAGSSTEPSALPLSERISETIDLALAALTPRRREVVRLRLVEGLSTRETAERMQIAPGTVKATLHAGRRDLRASLQLLWSVLQNGDL